VLTFATPISFHDPTIVGSVSNLIQHNFAPKVAGLFRSGQNAIRMVGVDPIEFIHTYVRPEYSRIPRYLILRIPSVYGIYGVVYKQIDNISHPGNYALELTYKQNINLVISIHPRLKQSDMYYVLTGLLCYQETVRYHGHFVAITLQRINTGTNNITYTVYNEDYTANITTATGSQVFPSGEFDNLAHQNGNGLGSLHPYFLIYERYGDYTIFGPLIKNTGLTVADPLVKLN
jgi:hypothetical protein